MNLDPEHIQRRAIEMWGEDIRMPKLSSGQMKEIRDESKVLREKQHEFRERIADLYRVTAIHPKDW